MPQVGDVETEPETQEPLRTTAEGVPVFSEWSEDDPPELTPVPEEMSGPTPEHTAEIKLAESQGMEWGEWKAKVNALDKMNEAELLQEAGVDPAVSTTEAAEYFDRTTQWIYWGLKPDPETGEHVFVWPDGTPIVPDRIGDPVTGRRRFTMPILRAILQSCYRRGNIEAQELQDIIRRIRYTELGVEWREREGWKYVDMGRNRHRWAKAEDAYYDRRSQSWRLKKKATK